MGNLIVRVVRAEGLTGIRRSHVVVTQGQSQAKTKPQDGPAPNYDRNTMIEFNISDENAPVLFSIVDSERDISLMDTQIEFEKIL